MRRRILYALLSVPLLAAPGKVDFQREVRPILSDKCFACHGPDEQKRFAKLRLDTRDGALEQRKGYAIVLPGNSAQSRLWQRVAEKDDKRRMPPPSHGPALTAKEIATLRRWIEEGAEWKTHWAFEAPQRPALPEVRDTRWVRNEIDRFVLARLEQEGLKPSPEADRATLLRRVSFDLTGLPPAPAELDAFLADKSPGAYEKAVDRLLASPRYGERMALQWLDLARYADTHGFHIDSHRDMWPWRDWVIKAFNANMPYDRFTVEQLAGDLLPKRTREQHVASGFNRNHMINFEGGAIPEEYQTEYVVDRVDTTSAVFLGLTAGCARCHDHKYDPIRQKEYYQLFAFFNNVAEEGLDGRKGNAVPVLPLPSPDQERRLNELATAQSVWAAALDKDEIAKLQAAWEQRKIDALPAPPKEGLLGHWELDGSLSDLSGRYQQAKLVKGGPSYAEGAVNRGLSLTDQHQLVFGKVLPLGQPWTISCWVRPNEMRTRLPAVMLQALEPGEARRGLELRFEDIVGIGDVRSGANLYVRLANRWPEEAIEVRTKELIRTEDWHHIALAWDGKELRLAVDGEPRPVEVRRNTLRGPVAITPVLQVGDQTLGPAYVGRLDDLRVFGRALAATEMAALWQYEPIRAALLNQARSKDQETQVRSYFLTHDAPEYLRTAFTEWTALEKERQLLVKQVPTTMVMAELERPRETFVLGRGDYRNKTEKVQPGVPSFLPPMAKDLPRNRLGLAQWLIDPQHPLTGRVAVNRFWQMHFGTGLVKTSEDFGSQGELPSHPELLDWLATEFVRTGWDVKALHRKMVTSATYRQASKLTPALHERDPENRLLARGPRFRLPAEMVRDNALAVSGLLKEKVGGPSVNPYQPDKLWDDIAFGAFFSAQEYEQGHGDDLHRRSLYTFWKRTSPSPTLLTFDAPDREKCTARRAVTNTPLQALVLLNDPTFVEAARQLAQRTLHTPKQSDTDRLRGMFRTATSRAPRAGELQVLRGLLQQERLQYRRDTQAAAQLLTVGESPVAPELDKAELAAWTTVASAILNLDEVITKE